MAALTPKQKEFLKNQNILISETFDATGLSTSEYKRRMRERNLAVAFGVTPCKRAGHSLRSRSGSCVQCGTHHLAFQRREHELAYLYLAYSASLGLIKIGVAKSPKKRKATIKCHEYGGANDWTIIEENRYQNAGSIERMAQKSLAQYRVERIFNKQGVSVMAKELFKCDLKTAQSAIKHAAKKVQHG